MKKLIVGVTFMAMAAYSAAAQPSAPVGGIPCDDITKLDFRNLTFQTAGRTFSFHNGVAENGPQEPVPADGSTQLRREWVATDVYEWTVPQESGVVVRLLLIRDSHQTGSGDMHYVVGFRCLDGKLSEVFSQHALSLKVESIDSSGITFSKFEHAGDPKPTRSFYVWDGRKYVASSKK